MLSNVSKEWSRTSKKLAQKQAKIKKIRYHLAQYYNIDEHEKLDGERKKRTEKSHSHSRLILIKDRSIFRAQQTWNVPGKKTKGQVYSHRMSVVAPVFGNIRNQQKAQSI